MKKETSATCKTCKHYIHHYMCSSFNGAYSALIFGQCALSPVEFRKEDQTCPSWERKAPPAGG